MDKLAYLQGEPTARGMLKQQFADFKVSEELGFEMGGNGEHLFLYIKKQNLSTIEVARKIAAVAEARIAMVGYAGMKDKKAECTQWFSVPLQKEKGAVKENENQSIISRLEDENIKIISTVRNNRKLKIGSHKRNLFDITLRNCLEGREEFDANLDKIKQFGVPNYYGFQRFGRELSNLKQVDKLIHDPQTNTKRRQKSFKKGMLISAARAYVFNQVLSSRITNNNWSQFVAGDVINLDGTARNFIVEEGAWDATLQKRLENFDIHLTGPLLGKVDSKDKYISSGKAADIEKAEVDKYPKILEYLQKIGAKSSRRPLRFLPEELRWAWLDDCTLNLSFALSPGAYATSLLREVCKTDQ
ncbi:tRNA pseudouridine(13) synthase TruD [Gammaproteobacteria bacterium]|nr:tRNA pseudouridine(13) synthase TruD [Gammaproteobacteria bacterium]